jgi:hypothetical protein
VVTDVAGTLIVFLSKELVKLRGSRVRGIAGAWAIVFFDQSTIKSGGGSHYYLKTIGRLAS